MTALNQTYEWYAVVEPASKPNVAEPTASMTATLSSLTEACYWISDLAELGNWDVSKATITRVPAHSEV